MPELRCAADVEGLDKTVSAHVTMPAGWWEASTEEEREDLRQQVRDSLFGAARRQLNVELHPEDVARIAVTPDWEPWQIERVRQA